MAAMHELDHKLGNRIAELVRSTGVPGYVAGIHHDGSQTLAAHGFANTATRLPMTVDTGFLFGSVTKVLTTTLLMRHVEDGQINLDERVTAYLPGFRLATPGHAEELRVRNLLNHTSGIDADILGPSRVNGVDAMKTYVETLAQCGSIFDVNQYASYSNPGFVLAGRLLEVVTGNSFADLLDQELFGPVGMTGTCASAERAPRSRTAVGHFAEPGTSRPRPTGMFALPASIAAAGSTPIGTVADLLAFGRTHLADGVAPSGTRVLARELARLMQTMTHDMTTPSMPPVGLGWWLMPFGQTVGLFHGGGSPGGTSALLVVPDQGFVFAAYGNGPAAASLHDRLILWLLRDHLSLDVPETPAGPSAARSLRVYEGTYLSHQVRTELRAAGEGLVRTVAYEPIDDDHARMLARFFSGGTVLPVETTVMVPVGGGLFTPAGQQPPVPVGPWGRLSVMSFHDWDGERPGFVGHHLRLQPRTSKPVSG
ncbi:serine hydrolase domain-containing protein [Streptomyces sp. NPDC002659]|uniref:serine hydrolase domain-containing protein n=1 Tax=Streptomyces sp. NPDC002659 TaxID=3364656 RepID=UPI0036C42FE8